ncbi:unnamed protein product [Urochloa humidicola]
MGCVSSKILAKSGSYQETGSLSHSFQRSSVIEEIILSGSKSNGDQFLALLCASNSTPRKGKELEPEQSSAPTPMVAEPAAKIETINVSELLAGLEEDSADEPSDRKDGDDRSPSPRVSEGAAAAAAGRARSFRTVEEFDALVTQHSGSSPSERSAEREEPRAAESSGGASGLGGEAEEEAAGARRRARARQLGELKVPAAGFDFSKSGSLRDWLRQGGQTFSPGSYVTPKFGTAPPVPAEHGGSGDKATGEAQQGQEQEQEVFDPELVAQFERAMEQLSEDEGRVLDEILEALESQAGENKDDTAAPFSFDRVFNDRPAPAGEKDDVAAAFSFERVVNDRPAAVAAQQV